MSFKITGCVEPLNYDDNYPVIDPIWGIDGLRSVSSLSEMYDIPIERRRGGMIVGVQDTILNTTDYYTLKPGVTWSVGTLSVTDWDPLFVYGAGATAVAIKYNIASETVVVAPNHQYLLYGNLNIGTGGDFQSYGETYIINGTIVLTGSGTYSVGGAGSINYVSLSQTDKYTATFSASPGATVSFNHSLNSEDILWTVRDGYNFIYPNIEILDLNSILLTTTGTISNGRINILK